MPWVETCLSLCLSFDGVLPVHLLDIGGNVLKVLLTNSIKVALKIYCVYIYIYNLI